MKRIIRDADIRKANDIERCKILLELIKGQAIYTQDLKTH